MSKRQKNQPNGGKDRISDAAPPTKQELAKSEVHVAELVTGVRMGMADLAVYTGQQERHSVKTETHVGADATIERWEQAYRARKAREKTTPPSPAASRTGTEVVLASQASHALVGTSLETLSRTPLEDDRRKKGLDRERRAIYKKLTPLLQPKGGIAMINKWAKKYLGRPCTTMQDVRELFPELTSTELAMFPLLKDIPDEYTLYGTGFNSLEVKRKSDSKFGKDDDLKQKDLALVPFQVEMRVDGIAYGSDGTNLNKHLEEDKTNPEDQDIAVYKEDIAEDIGELVMLTIEFPRLFEILQKKTTDALPVGVGRIQKEALDRVRARHPSQEKPTEKSPSTGALRLLTPHIQLQTLENLRSALKALQGMDREEVTAEEQAIADMLIESDIHAGEKDRAMSLHELVHILGLLDSIPMCLRGKTPFAGKMLFYGTHLLFADANGVIVEACPFSPECARTVRHSILDEATESSERNRTMMEIREQLTTIAQTAIFGKFARGEKTLEELKPDLSFTEARALELQARTGVTLQVLGERTLKELVSMPGKGHRAISSGAVAMQYMKMGCKETEQMANILERLGSALLAQVSVVRKRQTEMVSHEALGRLQTTEVTYDPKERAITIVEPRIFSYAHLNANAQHERSFQVAYGCAASLWQTFPTAKKRKWEMFYRAAEQSGTLKDRMNAAVTRAELFVTAADAASERRGPFAVNNVSQIALESPEADFCAHFACFVLCQEEFKTKMQGNRVIQDKYREIESLITSLCGEKRAFDDTSLPVDIAQCGLKQAVPSLPKMDSVEDFRKFLQKESERKEKERHEPSVSDDVEHDAGEVMSEDERERKEKENLMIAEVKDILVGALESFEESTLLDPLAQHVGKLIYRRGAVKSVAGIRATIRKKRRILMDFSEDPEGDIIDGLVSAGLIEVEEN